MATNISWLLGQLDFQQACDDMVAVTVPLCRSSVNLENARLLRLLRC